MQQIRIIGESERIIFADGNIPEGKNIPENCWIDLIDPTSEQEKAVESILGIDIPTRQELISREALSRFDEALNSVSVTAFLISNSTSEKPTFDVVTFIITGKKLITCRYSSPQAFDKYEQYLKNHPARFASPHRLLEGLLSAIIQRLAEVNSLLGKQVSDLSYSIFSKNSVSYKKVNSNLQTFMYELGASGTLAAKVRESLSSLDRMISFILSTKSDSMEKSSVKKFISTTKEIRALNEHLNYILQEVNFLVSSVMGMISLQQNSVIKALSIVSMILMPPTLIASIYGMNFQFMPELNLHIGYPLAIIAMFISAVAPYLFFRKKGWL